MTGHTRQLRVRLLAIGIWILLLASIARWPFTAGGVGAITTAIALAPLLLPLPGLMRGKRRTLQWSPLTLAPALAMALTELLVNAPARAPATLSIALIFAAFATVVALLRIVQRRG
ncbi:MAG: DUF2069 domain-containing protein [Steroidobacteraceae bacterium]